MLIALVVGRLLFGAPFCWPALAGFITGYVIYDCVHYWTHHGKPKSRFAQQVRRLHMLHHFRDATRGFGVHAFWLDTVFGTAYRRDDTPGSDRGLTATLRAAIAHTGSWRKNSQISSGAASQHQKL